MIILNLFERFFDIIYEKELNGGVGYPILLNNTKEFHKNDVESNEWLKKILDYDEKLTKEKKIPVLFWYSIGKPKPRELIRYNELLPND